MSVIDVHNLTMTYRVPVRGTGVRAAVASLWRRQYRRIEAVRSISFAVEAGEVIGFIGPNGAGKTTTLKMLAGVLHPTSGDASVLGVVPWRRERAFLRQIAMVRGSRPIGVPLELTVMDALRLQQLIYELSAEAFRTSLDELVDLLDLGQLLDRQVRALSLGERARAGLAWALVYRPRVLFLDEPTIGMDVAAVASMREFVSGYATRTGATVLLTSHYMADVERLCRRIVLIDRGAIAYDGALAGLAARIAPYKLLRIAVTPPARPDWSRYGEVMTPGEAEVVLRVSRDRVPTVTAQVLAELPVADLGVAEPPLEAVMQEVYRRA